MSAREVIRDLMDRGVKGFQVKATFTGYRNSSLVMFHDLVFANKTLVHVHVRTDSMVASELAQLQPGDRVLMTADPEFYVSAKHPDGNVSLMNVHVVKRLNRTRKGFKRST